MSIRFWHTKPRPDHPSRTKARWESTDHRPTETSTHTPHRNRANSARLYPQTALRSISQGTSTWSTCSRRFGCAYWSVPRKKPILVIIINKYPKIKERKREDKCELLGGWCETCSAMKLSWSRVDHVTGPSLTRVRSLLPLCSSCGTLYQHWNISPRIGLYGFFATGLLRPACNVDKYHFITCIIRSWAFFFSTIL